MIFILTKKFSAFFRWLMKIKGLGLAGILLGLVLISWAFMSFFEGSAPITRADSFWWYFIVTVTTVGYGDLYPVTLGGRITAACIMLVNIGLIAVIITRVSEFLFNFRQKRLKGLMPLKLSNHVVVCGFVPERTQAIVREILADTPHIKDQIVLCATGITDNPMPGDLHFVQGNPSKDDVLKNACIGEADKIIVYGSDDNQTTAYGIAASHHNRKAHIVAYFNDSENMETLRRVNPRIECIGSMAVQLLAHAMQDAGVSRVIMALTSHRVDSTLFRLNVPPLQGEKIQYSDAARIFKNWHHVTVIGTASSQESDAEIDLNPKNNVEVRGGMSLFYIGDDRLEDKDIDWSKIVTEVNY